MQQIQGLTTDPLQTQTFSLPDSSQVTIQIYFVPMQLGWFITSITYGDFTLQGIRITTNPNILYQWRNQIPFGIACLSPSGREPTQQADFATAASSLYVLTASETEAIAEFYSGE